MQFWGGPGLQSQCSSTSSCQPCSKYKPYRCLLKASVASSPQNIPVICIWWIRIMVQYICCDLQNTQVRNRTGGRHELHPMGYGLQISQSWRPNEVLGEILMQCIRWDVGCAIRTHGLLHTTGAVALHLLPINCHLLPRASRGGEAMRRPPYVFDMVVSAEQKTLPNHQSLWTSRLIGLR